MCVCACACACVCVCVCVCVWLYLRYRNEEVELEGENGSCEKDNKDSECSVLKISQLYLQQRNAFVVHFSVSWGKLINMHRSRHLETTSKEIAH